jgi:hypothetical protein
MVDGAQSSERNSKGDDPAHDYLRKMTVLYDQEFEQNAERAKVAKRRADDVLKLLRNVLEENDVASVHEDMDEADLRQTLVWGAFDYSHQDAETGHIEAVEPEILLQPLIGALVACKWKFPAAQEDFKNSILALRLCREGIPRQAPADPSEAFVDQFEAVNGVMFSPVPPQQTGPNVA